MDTILKYSGNIFSQCGEDLILEEVIKRTDPIRTCAEFGAGNAVFCSNTYKLIRAGWRGIMIESNPEELLAAMVNLRGYKCDYMTAMVTPDNVNQLLHKSLGVLSMDTDGPDAGIWSAYNGTADIVVIEINSGLDPEIDFYHPLRGANFSYMNRLAEAKGYFLLCHTGNCIYILNKYLDLFPDRDLTFKRDWL